MAISGRVISRKRCCRYCGDLHEVGAWPDNCKDNPWPKGDYPAPMIMNATLGGGDGLINPVDGKRYANRRQFEAEVQAHGCTVTGGEFVKPPSRTPSDADIVGDIKKSLDQLGGMSDAERSNMMTAQETATPAEMAAAGL